ncbi:MAG: chromosomal replication initiator protein DnaA [candidate division Zixibacteria bacterium]|nr:chromosomal replication initiator protein DnaA [candidate division Zixibacteria bacterium]
MPGLLWKECLKIISETVKKESFHTWFKKTRGLDFQNGSLIVGVPNQFVGEWIRQHFQNDIQDALTALGRGALVPVYQITPQLAENEKQAELSFPHSRNEENGERESRTSVKTSTGDIVTAVNGSDRQNSGCATLNPAYTFDSFIVGDANRFAQKAAQAVAESPGLTRYNPLIIYGGVGLGKTHLLQAVGNYSLSRSPRLNVVYATSERFINDFIQSIGKQNGSDFNQTYRCADILLIDDIQFLAGKESTQIQFFHIFNNLHLQQKQIILSSDRPPQEINGLQERLLSRFRWGLLTDVQPPDLETRIAILNYKAKGDRVSLPGDVATYIAENFTSNIRELEGAGIRVLAYTSIWGKPLTLTLAKEILQDSIRNGHKEITLEEIVQRVGSAYQISRTEINSKRKQAQIAWARQVGMYLARNLTDYSLKLIGEFFGGRDHSTVVHACSVVSQTLKTNLNQKRKVDQIINLLGEKKPIRHMTVNVNGMLTTSTARLFGQEC